MTPSEIKKVWSSFSSKHAEMTKRKNYFDGKHKFLLSVTNNDGTLKSNATVNFIEYIVKTHVAGNTGIPIAFSLQDPNADPQVIDNLGEVLDWNDSDTIDAEHFRNSLIFGYSVEVHSTIKGQISIDVYDPREWAFVFDTLDNIHMAIHKSEIPANTFFDGQILEKPLTVYTVYDSQTIKKYKQGKTGLEIYSEEIHLYGVPPIVLFSVSKDRSPFISQSLMDLNDSYNKTFNTRNDDIAYNVDAMMVFQGFDPSQKDANEKLAQMKSNRMITTPDDKSDFKFVTKGNEIVKYESALKDTRMHVFNQGFVPDINEIVGTTGVASALALKLKFQPTIQQSGFFTKYFEKAIRARIDLFNTIWAILKYPILEDYKVTFTFNMPTDNAEIRKSLKELIGLYSQKTILDLSPDIEDTNAELEQLQREGIPQNGEVISNPVEEPQPKKKVETNPTKRRQDAEKAIDQAKSDMKKELEKGYFEEISKLADSWVNSGALDSLSG